MTIRCCYDCKDRYPGCHSKCEKYNDEKDELERKKEYLTRYKREYTYRRKSD